jgi:hypothetical protein
MNELTGKTPAGRAVRLINRPLPWTGERVWTVANVNCIWMNGTYEECLAFFRKVTQFGFRLNHGEVL